MEKFQINLEAVRQRWSPLLFESKAWLSVIDQIIYSGTNFLTSILVARFSGKAQFAIYILIFTIVGFAMIVQRSLVSIPYAISSTRFHSRRLSEYTGNTLILQSFISLFLGLTIFAFGPVVASRFGFDLTTKSACFMSVAIVLILFRECVRQLMYARLLPLFALKSDLLVGLVQIMCLGVLIGKEVLSAANAIYVLGASCSIGMLPWLFRGTLRPQFNRDDMRADIRLNWNAGGPILLSNSVSALTQFYPWLVATFQGVVPTALFAACMGVVAIADRIVTGLYNYFGPLISRAHADGGPRGLASTLGSTTLYLLALTGAFCICAFFFGNHLVSLLYGKQYGSAAKYIVFFIAVATCAEATGWSAGYGLWVVGRSMANFKINIVQVIVTASLGIYFVRSLGPVGAALGLMSGSVIALILRVLGFGSVIREELRSRTHFSGGENCGSKSGTV